jgi:hypothetical protein
LSFLTCLRATWRSGKRACLCSPNSHLLMAGRYLCKGHSLKTSPSQSTASCWPHDGEKCWKPGRKRQREDFFGKSRH